MTLREEILKEHSKMQASYIAGIAAGSQKKFDELMHLFLTDEYRVVQRAAWSLSEAALLKPGYLHKHLTSLLDYLDHTETHPAVPRNILRILSEVKLPEELQGKLLAKCFELVEHFDSPVAVKAYALIILEKLAAQYPEIIPELKMLVTDRAPHETAAFRARAKRILKLKDPK